MEADSIEWPLSHTMASDGVYSALSPIPSVVISFRPNHFCSLPTCLASFTSFLLISEDELSLSLLRAYPATSATGYSCSPLLWVFGPFICPVSLPHLQPLPPFDVFFSTYFFSTDKVFLKK